MSRRALAVALAAVGLAVLPAVPAAAHPLGNFTVNTADRLVVTADGVTVLHVVDLAELPTVQLGQSRAGVDTDDDGRLSPAELTAYAGRECARVAPLLELVVDGSPVALDAVSSRAESRPGSAGLLTTRVECAYGSDVRPRSDVRFSDAAAGERNGWREVTAGSDCGDLRDSSVPAESPSGLLDSYPEELLSSPSDVTTASFSVQDGAACATGASSGDDTQEQVAPRGLDRISRAFTDFVNPSDLSAAFAVVALVASVLFGALHALAPGHGKTVMAAYLVGQRGTRRQALQLGAFVTFSHTASVLALGLAISTATLVRPELVVPATEVLSGVLLAAVGVYLLVLAVRRLRGTADHVHGDHEHGHSHSHDGGHSHDHDHGGGGGHDHGERHGHSHGDHSDGEAHRHPHDDHGHWHSEGHSHDHDHDHDHDHGGHDNPHPHEHPPVRELVPAGGPAPAAPAVVTAPAPLVHSHGGRAHSHAPLPEGRLSLRTLAAVGVAGGLVPSPSALLVLLGATAVGRAWFGVLLVVAYGLGMAVTLTAAGLLLLRARDAVDRRGWSGGRAARWARLLPVVTAGVVLVLGLVLVLRGIGTGRPLL